MLPLHFPIIDFISDKKYNPCPEFNRGLCQANHPHEDDEDRDGKLLDAICEICRYATSLNNPHPAHKCKLSKGLDGILARRKRKYEDDELKRERDSREKARTHRANQEQDLRRDEHRAGPSGIRHRLEPPRIEHRREQPPYSREWGQKRPRHW